MPETPTKPPTHAPERCPSMLRAGPLSAGRGGHGARGTAASRPPHDAGGRENEGHARVKPASPGAGQSAHPRSPLRVAGGMPVVDLLPSAEVLLDLEVEELAALLLEDIHRQRGSHGQAQFYIDGQFEFVRGRHDDRWPQHRYKALNVAVAEAAAWLEREVLIVRDPAAPISRGGPYVLTRRGLRMRNRADVAAYRETAALPLHLLHPAIAGKVAPMFTRGDHDVAVVQAFKAVEVAVRTAANLGNDKVGKSLMLEAFNPDKGALRDGGVVHAEREAEMFLFAGAIGHGKNPGSHRDVEMDRTEAARLIIFASHLLALVDKRR